MMPEARINGHGDPGVVAVALDMDGVIFDTVEAKANAFLSVFQGYPQAERSKIDSYNRANFGIPRADKMRYVASHILGMDQSTIAEWLDDYADILASSAGPPPLIAGATELFLDSNIDTFVCSSAPEAEIRSHLAAHGLETFTKGIFGFPVSKTEALKRLKLCYGSDLCFVGDALADRKAALDTGVRFILRSAEQLATANKEEIIPDLQDYRHWVYRNP